MCAHPSYMAQEAGARAAEMEAAATKMAGELAEYKTESKELHNQEHTIRRLEDKTRSLEAQLEDKVPFPCTCCSVRTQLRSESVCSQLSSLHSPPPSLYKYFVTVSSDAARGLHPVLIACCVDHVYPVLAI